METPQEDRRRLATLPEAMLDAGGEPWSRIRSLVTRRLDDMGEGEVLELVSQRADIHGPLHRWCREARHDLTHAPLGNAHTLFHIRKRHTGPITRRLDEV